MADIPFIDYLSDTILTLIVIIIVIFTYGKVKLINKRLNSIADNSIDNNKQLIELIKKTNIESTGAFTKCLEAYENHFDKLDKAINNMWSIQQDVIKSQYEVLKEQNLLLVRQNEAYQKQLETVAQIVTGNEDSTKNKGGIGNDG